MRKSVLTLALAIATALIASTPALGVAYVGAGTFVARGTSTPIGPIVLDQGGVVCSPSGAGVGGACIPFRANGARSAGIQVVDDVAGGQVAFQVCIDNNGDGVCGGDLTGKCDDQIFFSHADGGEFFNPLGPLPSAFLEGCQGGYPGFVVFICDGVHDDRQGPHHHAVTRGQVTVTDGGSGYGNFCGGATGGSAGNDGFVFAEPKPYVAP